MGFCVPEVGFLVGFLVVPPRGLAGRLLRPTVGFVVGCPVPQ